MGPLRGAELQQAWEPSDKPILTEQPRTSWFRLQITTGLGLFFFLLLNIITSETGAGVICSHPAGRKEGFAEPRQQQAEQPACQPNFSVKDVGSSANTGKQKAAASCSAGLILSCPALGYV